MMHITGKKKEKKRKNQEKIKNKFNNLTGSKLIKLKYNRNEYTDATHLSTELFNLLIYYNLLYVYSK